jgi:L-arabinose transport system permease protein
MWDNSGMLLVFIVLFVLLSIFVPYFFTWRNIIGLGLSVSMVGMVACTMLFCLASGDFDLSVENIVAFSGVTAVVLINQTSNVALGIIAGVLAGGLIGLINGLVIAKAGINALITTLAMSQIVRGLAL